MAHFGIPEQHMINWGDALATPKSKSPPWSNTPEYHQWGAQDVTQEKSKEIAQDYGNLAAGAFELGAPFMALGASPIYDIAQAFGRYEDEPEKYEVNNKWDKINAYFPDLQGTTVSGILNAIDMEDPLSAAYNRMIGAAKPTYNRIMRAMRDKRATRQGLNQVGMQRQIRAAEAVNQGRQNIGGGWTQTNTGGGGATFSGPGGQTHQGWSNTPAGYAAAAASEGSFAQGGRIGRKEIIARGGILGAF